MPVYLSLAGKLSSHKIPGPLWQVQTTPAPKRYCLTARIRKLGNRIECNRPKKYEVTTFHGARFSPVPMYTHICIYPYTCIRWVGGLPSAVIEYQMSCCGNWALRHCGMWHMSSKCSFRSSVCSLTASTISCQRFTEPHRIISMPDSDWNLGEISDRFPQNNADQGDSRTPAVGFSAIPSRNTWPKPTESWSNLARGNAKWRLWRLYWEQSSANGAPSSHVHRQVGSKWPMTLKMWSQEVPIS